MLVNNEKISRYKITPEDALEIIRLHQSGIKQASLASKYNVSQQQVNRIVTGKRWVRKLELFENRKRYEQFRKTLSIK